MARKDIWGHMVRNSLHLRWYFVHLYLVTQFRAFGIIVSYSSIYLRFTLRPHILLCSIRLSGIYIRCQERYPTFPDHPGSDGQRYSTPAFGAAADVLLLKDQLDMVRSELFRDLFCLCHNVLWGSGHWNPQYVVVDIGWNWKDAYKTIAASPL